jgi:hypothetical protein
MARVGAEEFGAHRFPMAKDTEFQKKCATTGPDRCHWIGMSATTLTTWGEQR